MTFGWHLDSGKLEGHLLCMQLIIDIDDETYADIEAMAKEQHASVDSVASEVLSRYGRVRRAVSTQGKLSDHFRIPVSESESFTMEDVHHFEDESDLRQMA